MISVEKILEHFKVEGMVKSRMRTTGTYMGDDVVGDITSDVHWRILRHGPFESIPQASVWIYCAIRSCTAEVFRQRANRRVFSYDNEASPEPQYGDRFSDFIAEYNPYPKLDKRIALCDTLEGIKEGAPESWVTVADSHIQSIQANERGGNAEKGEGRDAAHKVANWRILSLCRQRMKEEDWL